MVRELAPVLIDDKLGCRLRVFCGTETFLFEEVTKLSTALLLRDVEQNGAATCLLAKRELLRVVVCNGIGDVYGGTACFVLSVAIRAVVQKYLDDFAPVSRVKGGSPQGSVAVLISQVYGCTGAAKEFRGGGTVVLSGEVQRREPASILRIDVGVVLDEKFHQLNFSLKRRQHERCSPVPLPHVWVGSLDKQTCQLAPVVVCDSAENVVRGFPS